MRRNIAPKPPEHWKLPRRQTRPNNITIMRRSSSSSSSSQQHHHIAPTNTGRSHRKGNGQPRGKDRPVIVRSGIWVVVEEGGGGWGGIYTKSQAQWRKRG
ncbi:hypothetical protein PoB_006189400 [Plakobranchus ocellatus]|uniref:Uncharacterized protein n=1 Tax=Plakobranchus ocellatus TaxID=259542 RepID=A0AAV4CU15_9GAST|nr:hypothetical protein PoB_006189400 [Plakobranchus ocellatus]